MTKRASPISQETKDSKMEKGDNNNLVLDEYNLGWGKGDSEIIYSVLDESYTFTGLPNTEPVNKDSFKFFWRNFRNSIEDGGGPKVSCGEFMTFKNVIRKNIGDSLVESGQWECPGFASGVYMILAKNGKIAWETVTM